MCRVAVLMAVMTCRVMHSSAKARNDDWRSGRKSLADQPLALVLGSEGRGLARLTRQRCDLVVAIPAVGSLASLNVAAAGAVACFEVARQRLALSY